MLKLTKIKRLPNKIKREFLQLPPIQSLSERAYQKIVEKHSDYLPPISPADSTLLNSLQEEGVLVTTLEALAIPSTDLFTEAAKKLLFQLQALPTIGKDVVILSNSQIASYPEIILWGVEERLINIIENYIEMPVRYYGAGVRREIANGKMIDVRQWHRDIEDRRMVKIIIYLNDVNIEGGPFEYISKPLTLSSSQTLKYNSGFVSDRDMKSVVSISDWKPCTGPSGTVVFADTSNVFHRAKAPVALDRFSITYTYTSIKPIASRASNFGSTISQEQWQTITDRLNPRQKECF
ncbi:hypothetical protein IQ238_26575 [Pleurocapsales cyanobacterium LEGE 06147]|nr:hypothetical protein [Pleurocapsales cyanobacterium LEGE 06147]